MTKTTEHIFQEAIQLNPIDRVELVEKLLSLFSTNETSENEIKWKEEVERRKEAFENGEIPSDSMNNVFDRLAQR